jgi:hypothetical protein
MHAIASAEDGAIFRESLNLFGSISFAFQHGDCVLPRAGAANGAGPGMAEINRTGQAAIVGYNRMGHGKNHIRDRHLSNLASWIADKHLG